MKLENLERARTELRVRRLELQVALNRLTDPPTLEDMAYTQRCMTAVREQTRLVRRLTAEAA